MRGKFSIEELWSSARPVEAKFDPVSVDSLPAPAAEYFRHSIAPGAPLASAVRLRMHGEIRLGGWSTFEAEQVITRDRGMLWRASARIRGLPVRGSDSFVDGRGRMKWKILGLIPVMKASGRDIDRSAAGRTAAEHVWLPSAMLEAGGSFSSLDRRRFAVSITTGGHESPLVMETSDGGGLLSVCAKRWGDPGGSGFGYHDFGGYAESEATFGGYTIPTRLRIGWYFGGPRFEEEGEFFRVTVDEAEFA